MLIKQTQDVYRMSESKLRLHALLQRATIHGRRINDEVELFEWDEGKVTQLIHELLRCFIAHIEDRRHLACAKHWKLKVLP